MDGRDGTVISDTEAAALVTGLCEQLRAARLGCDVSTRAAAERAGVNLGTLWRIEAGRNVPAWHRFTRLAGAAGVRVELDDGHDRPRTLDPTAVALLPHYRPGVPVVSAGDADPFATVESHWERVGLRAGCGGRDTAR